MFNTKNTKRVNVKVRKAEKKMNRKANSEGTNEEKTEVGSFIKEASPGKLKIQIKLIGVFLIPVGFIILLGVISYLKSSNALISNYKTAALSDINNMASYYDLGLHMVSDKATLLNTNSTLKDYYSGRFQDDKINEQKKFKDMEEFVYANILSDSIIKNMAIFGSYGNSIITNGTAGDSLYDKFSKEKEGAAFINSGEKNQWLGNHPLLDQETGSGNDDYSISYISYLYNNNSEKTGFIVLDVSMDFIKAALAKSGLPKESRVAFVTRDGKEIRNDSEKGKQYFIGKEFYNRKAASKTSGFSDVTLDKDAYLFVYSYVSQCDSYLCALIPRHIITKQVDALKNITILIVLIASLAAIIFGTIISYGISKTIKQINKVLTKSASGNLTNRIKLKRKDEFLLLGNGINHLIDSIKELIREMAEVSHTVNAAAADVSGNSSILFGTSQNISTAVNEVKHGVVAQSEGTESCLVQMSDLSGQINHVSENAFIIRKSAEDTKEVIKNGMTIIEDLGEKAKKSSDIVRSVIDNIENLEQKSSTVSDIVKSIDSIAEQTNLLSLNASIEAARAGREGKGFEVVAGEIRKLSEQSSIEAERIKKIITQIQEQTRITVRTAKEADDNETLREEALRSAIRTFSDIDRNVEKLTLTLDNIVNGIKEIENEKDGTLKAVENISAISQQTTAAMDQLSSIAGEQLTAVEALNHAVKALGVDSNKLEGRVNIFKTEE